MEGSLEDQVYSLLSERVPKIVRDKDYHNAKKTFFDLEGVELIFSQLNNLVLGEGSDSIMTLRKSSARSNLCGKVFRSGDLIYSCSDCQMDPTCVLCSDCFQHSQHVNHHYNYIFSKKGGGYCDCGDVEAWKQDQFCSNHQVSPDNQAASSSTSGPEEQAGPELLSASVSIVRAIVRYCIELLFWSGDYKGPQYLDVSVRKCYLVLYNDEIHTFAEVNHMLENDVGTSRAQAQGMAMIVDEEGRSFVYEGETQSALLKKSRVEQSDQSSKPRLRCEVLSTELYAHQQFAILLLGWLNKLSTVSENHRRLICDVMFDDHVLSSHLPPITTVLLRNTSSWKAARIALNKEFIHIVLMDTTGKRRYADEVALNYHQMAQSFLKDDHKLEFSVFFSFIQIFTVQSIAWELLMKRNMLAVIMGVLQSVLNDLKKPGKSYIKFHRRDTMSLGTSPSVRPLFRAVNTLTEVKYLLHHQPTELSDQFRVAFLRGFNEFVRFLTILQGADPAKRMTGSHREYDSLMRDAAVFTNSVYALFPLMLKWCCIDKVIFQKSLHSCVVALLDWITSEQQGGRLPDNRSAEAWANGVDFGMVKVSPHYPVGRFLAGLLEHGIGMGLSLSEMLLDFMNLDQLFLNKLLELPLRSVTFMFEVNSDMWVRNGISVRAEMYHYQFMMATFELYQRDLFLIKVCAQLMGENIFIDYFLQRLSSRELKNIIKLSDIDTKEVQYLGEFFLLLSHLILDPPLGNLREKIIHVLACKFPSSRNAIYERVSYHCPIDVEIDNDEFDSILGEISTTRKGNNNSTVYMLRKELIHEVNRFYILFTKSDSSTVQDKSMNPLISNPDFIWIPPVRADNDQTLVVVQRLLSTELLKLTVTALSGFITGVITDHKVLHILLHFISVYVRKMQQTEDPEVRHRMIAAMTESVYLPSAKVSSAQQVLDALFRTSQDQDITKLTRWILQSLVQSETKTKLMACRSQDLSENSDRQQRIQESRARAVEEVEKLRKRFYESNKDELAAIDTSEKQSMDNTTPVSHICCICYEVTSEISTDKPLVALVLVKPSKVLTSGNKAGCIDLYGERSILKCLGATHHFFISGCGHVLHRDCLNRYSRGNMTLTKMESLLDPRYEFICPYCNHACNSSVPIIADYPVASSFKLDPSTCGPSHLESVLQGIIKKISHQNITRPAQPSIISAAGSLFNSIVRMKPSSTTELRIEFNGGIMLLESIVYMFSCVQDAYAGDQESLFSNFRNRQKEFYSLVCPSVLLALLIVDRSNLHAFIDASFYQFISTSPDFVLPTEPFRLLVYNFYLLYTVLYLREDTLMPTIFSPSDAGDLFSALLYLVYVLHLTQQLKLIPEEPEYCDLAESIIQEDEPAMQGFQKLWELVHGKNGLAEEESERQAVRFAYVAQLSLPFLRKSALLYMTLSRKSAPEELISNYGLDPVAEFRSLLKFLRLPLDPTNICLVESEDRLFPSFLKRASTWSRLTVRNPEELSLYKEPYVPFKLIDLTERYDDMLTRLVNYRCVGQNSTESSVASVVVCLVCGETLCEKGQCCDIASEDASVRRSSIARHAHACGAGLGLFLKLHDCVVLVVDSIKSSVLRYGSLVAPYLDNYGEPDVQLRRRKPLRLSKNAYRLIEKAWVLHHVTVQSRAISYMEDNEA